MLFKLFKQRGSVIQPLQLFTINARGSDQSAFSVGSQNDIAALTAAVIQATGANWYDGINTTTSWIDTPAIRNGPSKQTFINFGFTNSFNLESVSQGDIFWISKVGGSHIVVDSVAGSSAIGSTLTAQLSYYTADNEVVYRTYVTASGASSFDNTTLYAFPWLLNIKNPGNYNLLSPSIRSYSGKIEASLSQGQSGGRYWGIVPPASAALAAKFWGNVKPVDTDDPYQEIDDSTPSGPAEGDGLPDSDEVDIPSLPSVSVADTGFVTLFNPTLSQVQDLANYMWAGLFDINTFRKIFADPMDCILGFNMLPVAIPNSGNAAVTVGNISTGVQMTKCTGQWVEVDCGTLAVPEPYGSYLDWSPYVKISLMLPYIGIVELSTDDVMGKTLTLKYHVDVLSCACVAFLKCGNDTLYQFTGSCGYSIPVTGDNFKQMIANVVSIAATIGGAVASGGLTAPAAIAAGASTAQNVMNSKPEIHRSGSIGASAGIMGAQTPYLIMEIPRACKPERQYHYLGYPSFVTEQLGNLRGYAEFENVLLEGIPCTDAEREIIYNLCKGGIYL